MKKVVLISGTSRSGSSLLDLMIGNSNKGFSTGELSRLFRLSLNIHQPRTWDYNDEIINFWNNIKSKGEKNVYNNLFDSFKNVEYIVDSSKNPIWIRNQIKYCKNKPFKLIPIITYKTPIEFAYSLFKRDNLRFWKKQWIKTYSILFYILNNFITVKYSLLAKNPKNHLELICKKIGIDYFEGKEKFWENNSKIYFLFGSDTLRKSKEHVYYNSQYDKSDLDFVKKKIDTSDKIIEDILMILDAFEIGSKEKIDVKLLRKKERIGNFSLLNQLKMELETSKYHYMNDFFYKLKKNIDQLLKKIGNDDNR
jgi:hypothetical protein